MATRSTRSRRTPKPKAESTDQAAEVNQPDSNGSDGKLPAHLAHHRMIARNLNGLLENYGELRNQVIQIEREYKRTDKDLDSRLFQLRNQVEALDQRLAGFMEEMTTVAFELSLKIQRNTEQTAALWSALAAVGTDADEVARRQQQTVDREAERQAEVDRRLQELVDQQQEAARPTDASQGKPSGRSASKASGKSRAKKKVATKK